MNAFYGTGNETVDRLMRLQITGNVIPTAWYRTIRRETGKPYLIAIVILSDIVYWYRAAEVRDEGSGQLIGYKKRFRADLLQRSYQQLSEQFGITKRDATNAIVELEKLGVVRRVFKTMTVSGQSVPNVLFLDLNVDVLEKLTFPNESEEREWREEEEEPKGKKTDRKSTDQSSTDQKPTDQVPAGPVQRGCHSNRGDVSPKSERGITQIGDTPHRNEGDGVTQMGETNTEITYKDYNTEYPIQSYQEYQAVTADFKRQIEYDILRFDLEEKEELEELVAVAVEVLTSRAETIRVNREEKPAGLVKEQYRRITMFHIRYVLNCLRETETKARNIRAVMVTALYNSVNTIGTYHENLYQYHTGRDRREGEE